MTTVNVILPADMLDFIEQAISKGNYSSTSDVVREALQRMQDDEASEADALAALHREINIGLEDVRAGRFSQKTVGEIAEEVLKEFR